MSTTHTDRLNQTLNDTLHQIAARAYTEVTDAFKAWIHTNPNDAAASRAAHTNINHAQETLKLALVAAGHPVEMLDGGAVEGYYEINIAQDVR